MSAGRGERGGGDERSEHPPSQALGGPPARRFRTPLRGHAFAGPTPSEALETGREAELVREPLNPADPMAVAVWVEDAEGHPHRIGYLDRSVAARLAPRIDAGAIVTAVIEGWLDEPGGRWQRPLLRLDIASGPAEDLEEAETVHAEVWGRPPGVRRRRIDRTD